MTQDRTRAIVEAAERLAAATGLRLSRPHLDAEADGFVWIEDLDLKSPRARALHEAQFALARALALPAPPEPPRSAAEWLLSCAKEALAMTPTCMADEELRDELSDAVERYKNGWPSPIAPEWTRTPPSEPGAYWTRDHTDPMWKPQLVEVARGYDKTDPELFIWTFGGELCHPLSAWSDYDWFPVRIEEPPA